MANRRASLAWKDVLDADTSATFISADAAVNHTRAASGWEARRSVVLTPSAVRGSLIHTIARREAAPKGYLGEPITPASARSPSSAVSSDIDRKPSIGEGDDEEDDANDDVVDEESNTPSAGARPRATSDAFLPTPVKAGAVFPVRPNPLLLDPTSTRSLLHPSMSPHHHEPTAATSSKDKEKEKESKAVEQEEEIPDESLRQLPQVITSFLLKQGKARKKWSKRYFTLLPAKQQLIYTHQKKAKDKNGKKIKGTNVMSIEPVHVEGQLNSIHEESEGVAHLTSDQSHDITMMHAAEAADGQGFAEAPIANPAGGKMNITVISLKKFRMESMEELIDNGHITPQQLQQLKHDGEKQFCIIVPADSTTEETNKGNKGSPHKDANKDASNAGEAVGAAGGVCGESSSEKRIELRTSSAQLYDEWILQFRRLSFLQTFLSTYHAIISRNKAHALQGHFELINDPTGGLGDEFAQKLLTFVHDPTATAHLKKKPISEISLLTSFLTGDARRVCSHCQSAFGLTALEVICVDCQQSFCTKYTCSTPRSYSDEGVDTFSALQIKSFHDHKKRDEAKEAGQAGSSESASSSPTAAKPNHHHFPIKPPPPRLCLECERKRQCDPIYQKLLNGQLNLCLRIVSATSIMPTHLINKTSDPYVKFTVGKQEYKTSVISNTLNPVWDKDNEFNISWGDAASSSSALAAEDDSGASLSGASNVVKGMKNFLVAFGKPLASAAASLTGGSDSHDSFGGYNASGDALPKVLCLELFDHDPIGADTFMGCVYLPIFDFEKNVFYSDSFPLRPKKDGTGGGASQSDALHNLKSTLGTLAPLAGKPRKITGALQLQVILTTSTYTADLIKLLPSFEGLTKRNSLMAAAAAPHTPPQATKSPLASMRTSILTNIFGHHHHHKDSASDQHLLVPPVAPSPTARPTPKLTALELEIQSFLRTSHLHNLLLKSMDIILAFQLSEIIDSLNDLFTYKDPFLSIFTWVLYSIFILYFPSEWIMPLLPLLLLLHLVSNLMSSELKRGSELIAALIAAEEARAEKAALDLAADMKAARKASSIHTQLKGHLKGFGDLFKRKHDHHHQQQHQLTPTASAAAATSPTAASNQTSPALSPNEEQRGGTTPQLSPLSGGSPAQPPQQLDVHGTELPPPITTESGLTISAGHTDSPVLSPVAGSSSAVVSTVLNDAPMRTPADDEHLDDEERAGSVVFRMRRLKRQVKSLQYLLDCVFDGLEELIRMYEWKNVEKAQRCVRGCIFTFLLTYYLSVRWLLILAGVYKWSRHLLKLRRRIISMQDYKHNINLMQAMKAASAAANKTKHKK